MSRNFIAYLLCLFSISGAFSFQPRIGYGTNAPAGSAPHMVSFQNSEGHFCGGSIISALWIVTAAHCASEFGKPATYIEYGMLEISKGNRAVIEKFVVHLQYSIANGKIEHDIALVKVNQAITFTSTVKAIEILKVDVNIGQIGLAFGWGVTQTGLRSDVLQKATLTTIACITQVASWQHFTCLRSTTSYMCSADSGGPLVVGDKLAGVLSFGACQRNALEGFTTLSKYSDWIDTTMRSN